MSQNYLHKVIFLILVSFLILRMFYYFPIVILHYTCTLSHRNQALWACGEYLLALAQIYPQFTQ
jgi:hypothetical protein